MILLVGAASQVSGIEFHDDFSRGIDPNHWVLVSNQPLYTCQSSGGDVLISKPQGGGGWGQSGYMSLCFGHDLVGDFDVSVGFSDAQVQWNSEFWGNEAALEVGFGSRYFQVSRGDGEGGEYVGTWVDPPGVGDGFPETATSGRFRIARVGSAVTAYFDSTVVHSGDYGDEQVTHLCLSLKNNYADDPLSVRFDDVSIVADRYSPAPPGVRITASDGEDGDAFGDSVALHGRVLAVGAPEADREEFQDGRFVSGAVYVFAGDPLDPTRWREVRKISPPNGKSVRRFGEQVAVHGSTLVVGCPIACAGLSSARALASGASEVCWSGAAFIYDRDRGGTESWGLVATLETGDESGLFGASVSIDGDLLVIGAPGHGTTWSHSGPGRAFVFERDQGGTDGWGQVAELVGSESEDGGSFGTSVSVNGDTVIVGERRDDFDCPGHPACGSGSAYVFERNRGGENAWGEVAKLVPTLLSPDDRFGAATVKIDGDTAVVESLNMWASYIAIHVFDRNFGGGDGWGWVGTLGPPGLERSPLDLRGRVVLAGVTGAAAVFVRDAGGRIAWGEVARLSRRSGWTEGGFPSSVAIGDGLFAAGAAGSFRSSGGTLCGDTVGAVHMFAFDECAVDRSLCTPRRARGRVTR